MYDGMREKVRDEEGGQEENGQEKITNDIRRVKLPAAFYFSGRLRPCEQATS